VISKHIKHSVAGRHSQTCAGNAMFDFQTCQFLHRLLAHAMQDCMYVWPIRHSIPPSLCLLGMPANSTANQATGKLPLWLMPTHDTHITNHTFYNHTGILSPISTQAGHCDQLVTGVVWLLQVFLAVVIWLPWFFECCHSPFVAMVIL